MNSRTNPNAVKLTKIGQRTTSGTLTMDMKTIKIITKKNSAQAPRMLQTAMMKAMSVINTDQTDTFYQFIKWYHLYKTN